MWMHLGIMVVMTAAGVAEDGDVAAPTVQEGDAPGVPAELPEEAWARQREDTTQAHEEWATRPAQAVKDGARHAVEGTGHALLPGVVPGTRGALGVAGEGVAAAGRIVREFPSRGAVAADRARQQATILGNGLSNLGVASRQRVIDSARRVDRVVGQAPRDVAAAHDAARDERRDIQQGLGEALRQSRGTRNEMAGVIHGVAGEAMSFMAFQLRHGVPAEAARGVAFVSRVNDDGQTLVAEAVAGADDLPARAWRITGSAVKGTLARAWPETTRVAHASRETTRKNAAVLAETAPLPARVGREAVTNITAWNMERGWHRGWKAGMSAAEQAVEHDDPAAAVAFGTSAVGKAAWHLGVLQPLLLVAAGGVVASGVGAWWSVGLPVVMGTAAAGAGISALVPAAALLVITSTGALGSALSVAAAGGSVIRVAAAATHTLGTVALASVLGLSNVGVHAAAALLGVVLVPLLAAGALTWVDLHAAREQLAFSAAATAARAATHVEETFTVTGALAHAGAVGVVDPAGTAAMGARDVAVGRGMAADAAARTAVGAVDAAGPDPWRALVLPVAATVMEAGVLASSALVATGGVLHGAVLAAALGGVAAHSLVALGASTAGVAFLFARAGLDMPAHRRWAEFRQQQVVSVVDKVPGTEGAEVAVVRVTWWGRDTGRVRAAVVRTAGGKRIYMERVVDAESCRVGFRRTHDDPLARLGGTRWEGTTWTDVADERCEAASPRGMDVASLSGT